MGCLLSLLERIGAAANDLAVITRLSIGGKVGLEIFDEKFLFKIFTIYNKYVL